MIADRNKSTEHVAQNNQTQQPATIAAEPSATQTPTPTPTPFVETFAANNWLLESITVDGSNVDMNVNVPAPLTLNFDKTKKGYNGFAGCNNFSGTYAASAPNNFSFGDTIANKKFCTKSSGLENSLFKAMGRIQLFMITNGKLILTNLDGKTKIIYSPAI